MELLSLLLITAIIATYFILKYFFGPRIYFSQTFFVTIREVMLPLLIVCYEILCQIIFGYSQMPWMLLFCCIIGMVLLFLNRNTQEFVWRPFLYRFFSLIFLVFFVGCMILFMQCVYFLVF